MRHLAVVTKEYPSPGEPVYTFVEQLVGAIADSGVRVTVISPVNPMKRMLRGAPLPPAREKRLSPSGAQVLLLRPRALSFGVRKAGPVHLAKWTLASFEKAVRGALRRLPEMPDALYAHFIFPSGLTAGKIAKELSIPAFMAYGESSAKLFSFLGKEEIARRLKGLSGVVAVSGENAREIVQDGYYPFPERVKVFPNGVNPAEFSPMDRIEARKALGLPLDKFIVAFVGGFIERKGVAVLSRALDEVGASSLFVGRGPVAPDARDILFQGALDHAEIPKYLAAADVFALPTLNEGCCNAIVEALAMGLPVVSSDRPFNDELLTDLNAIRVDPTDVRAVAEAIRRLKDDAALRTRLAEGARRTGASLEIHARAAAILRFMEERL